MDVSVHGFMLLYAVKTDKLMEMNVKLGVMSNPFHTKENVHLVFVKHEKNVLFKRGVQPNV